MATFHIHASATTISDYLTLADEVARRLPNFLPVEFTWERPGIAKLVLPGLAWQEGVYGEEDLRMLANLLPDVPV